MKNKSFDCVELQHRGATLIYEQTKDMMLEEQLHFWRELTAALRERQKASQQKLAKRQQKHRPTSGEKR